MRKVGIHLRRLGNVTAFMKPWLSFRKICSVGDPVLAIYFVGCKIKQHGIQNTMHSYVKMSGPKRAQFNVQNFKLFFPVEDLRAGNP